MMKSLIENIIMETSEMSKQTILYFPDYRDGMKNEQEVIGTLQSAFPENKVVSVDLSLLLDNYEHAKEKVDEVLRLEEPEIIIADGLGAFFVHTLAGYNRICVNPILSATIYLNDSYRAIQEEQYAFDRQPDKENHTYCWGIFGEHASKRKFCVLHYPNIISVDRKVESVIDVLGETVVPLINNMSLSEYVDDYGVRYSNYGRTLVKADYVLFRDVENYEVPKGVRTIGECAFSGMSLKCIILPDSLNFIGKNAFSDCRSLESIVIPQNVDVIREGCFDGCVSLKDVQLPKSVFSIHRHAFTGTSLKTIEVPDSIQGIAPNAFDDAIKLVVSSSKLTELLQDSMHYQTIQSDDIIGFDI